MTTRQFYLNLIETAKDIIKDIDQKERQAAIGKCFAHEEDDEASIALVTGMDDDNRFLKVTRVNLSKSDRAGERYFGCSIDTDSRIYDLSDWTEVGRAGYDAAFNAVDILLVQAATSQ